MDILDEGLGEAAGTCIVHAIPFRAASVSQAKSEKFSMAGWASRVPLLGAVDQRDDFVADTGGRALGALSGRCGILIGGRKRRGRKRERALYGRHDDG